MSRRILALAALCAAVSTPALWAQNAPAPAVQNAATGAPIAKITEANVANLAAILPRRWAVSVEVENELLDDAARAALLEWTRNGGLVFLHNDVARSFGYVTVPARLGNNRQGGQLWGRARNALPFASHPLLTGARIAGGARTNDPARPPAVNVVFYEMNQTDHLVVSHPAGTPILEATDLAATGNRTLFAAAVAPFGRGLTIFTPSAIDQRRADGALFAANLLALLPAANTTPNATAPETPPVSSPLPPFVALSQAAIDAGGSALSAELERALAGTRPDSPALPAFGATPETRNPAKNAENAPQNLPEGAPAQPVAPETPIPTGRSNVAPVPVLLVTRVEAQGIQAAFANSAPNVLAILRARVALLRRDISAANRQLESLIENAPDAAETAFINALLNANLADDITQPSPQRALAAKNAADEFARAQTLRPLLAPPAAAPPTARGVVQVCGVPAATLGAYASEFNRLARLFTFEPPLVTSVGSGDSAVVVRFAADDAAYPVVSAAATQISNSRLLGWRTDRQEILLFPNEATYAAYRAASGQGGQNVPLPSAAAGDVVGSRITMVSIPATVIPRINPQTGQVQILPPRATSLSLLARLQAYANLAVWFDGGGRVPAWLAIGMENLVANAIGAFPEGAADTQTLQQFAQAGGLLLPAQFEALRGAPNDLAVAQATSLMDFFYRRYGAGAVTETVQRLAAGQSVDNALTATTGQNQIGFFTAWRNAQFGPQTFPNAP